MRLYEDGLANVLRDDDAVEVAATAQGLDEALERMRRLAVAPDSPTPMATLSTSSGARARLRTRL